MKRYLALSIFFSVLLQGCYSQGSSAPAPNNVAVAAGDTSATVTWDMLPGVEYWIFKAASSDVTPTSCFGLPECQMIMKAVSPALVTGLVNGTTYSFSINGRIDGGKGGSGSPAVQAVPRLAGAIWSVGTALSGDMNGIAYGTLYAAVGANGALYSSVDGLTWTPQTNPLPGVNLNAVTYSGGRYVAVGAGGAVLLSTDAITWQAQNSGTTNDLYAVSGNGFGVYIATGAGGTIITSADAVNWTAATPATANALNGVTYANNQYVAVGAAGTILTSSNLTTWQTVTPLTAAALKGITYGYAAGATTGIFVAIGDQGTVLTSTDGSSWTAQATTSPASLLTSVTYGRQFVATGFTGNIFTSTDGIAWTLATTATSALNAIAHGPYDYAAVGAAGLNMHSK